MKSNLPTPSPFVASAASLLWFPLAVFLFACGKTDPGACYTSHDCPSHTFCVRRTCQALPSQQIPASTTDKPPGVVLLPPKPASLTPADTPASTTTPGPQQDPPPCDPPKAGEIHLEEVLANVPPDPNGDADGNGTRNAYDDEFIKVSTSSNHPVSLKQVEIRVNNKRAYLFPPSLCLPANGWATLFSKTTINDKSPPNRISVNKRLSLNNSKGTIEIVRNGTDVLDRIEYGPNTKGSWVRIPIHSGPFLRHHDATRSYFSPDTCPDGTPWGSGCPVAK